MISNHFLNGKSFVSPYPQESALALFGLGCFWGAEKIFWQLPGVYSTAVGYSAGESDNPTYKEVCSGLTGHSEVVLIIYFPLEISYEKLLKIFWESHDPTQGMRQGADIGSQYRSIIITYNEEQNYFANKSKVRYSDILMKSAFGKITTEIVRYSEFFYAENYHQQYLAKNPNGYCSLNGTGIDYF